MVKYLEQWFCNEIKTKLTNELEISKALNASISMSNIAESSRLTDKVKALELELTNMKRGLKAGSFLNLVEPINYDKPIKITMDEVSAIIGGQRLVYTDSYFYGIDIDDVKRIIAANPNIRDSKYIAETYDCDDYAQAMHGLFNQQTLSRFAFGIACSDSHCFNIFVDRNKKLWIVEPQGLEIYTLKDVINKPDYKIQRWMI